jgi:hypothetical protein
MEKYMAGRIWIGCPVSEYRSDNGELSLCVKENSCDTILNSNHAAFKIREEKPVAGNYTDIVEIGPGESYVARSVLNPVGRSIVDFLFRGPVESVTAAGFTGVFSDDTEALQRLTEKFQKAEELTAPEFLTGGPRMRLDDFLFELPDITADSTDEEVELKAADIRRSGIYYGARVTGAKHIVEFWRWLQTAFPQVRSDSYSFINYILSR